MKIQNIDINKIKPYSKNAKKHTKKQVVQISESIKEFGINQPLVVDKDMILVVGHGRYEGCKFLGMKEVPVLILDNLTDEQINAYRLADNKLNESDWDKKLVIDELKELNLKGFDISITGFSKDLVIEGNNQDDIIPSIKPKNPRTKLGDLYEIGGHRILCGDSTDPENIKRLMNGVKADMVFTDHPYNVNYKGRGKNTTDHIKNDKMKNFDFDTFLSKAFDIMADNIKQEAGCYVFHASSTQAVFEKTLVEKGFFIHNQLIWNKPHFSMGWSDYHWKHEPFFYCGLLNSSKFYGDRTQTTSWKIPAGEIERWKWFALTEPKIEDGVSTIWSCKKDNVADYIHPTQKPVEIIQKAIANSSKQDDVVLDLFGGSGSTLIACHKMWRKAYLNELDPAFVDLLIERYCKYTKDYKMKLNGKDIEWLPLS